MELSTRPIARGAVAVALLIGLAAVALNWGALVRPLPPRSDTGVFEQIFGVTPVLAAIRIGTVILISYIAGSVVTLGIEGRLLVKAGPGGAEVEPAGALRDVMAGNQDVADAVTRFEESIDDIWEAIHELEAISEWEED